MGNINNKRKAFYKTNGIGEGTTSWRRYLDSEGFSGNSIVDDTKRMLVSGGSWVGSISESLSVWFDINIGAPETRWVWTPNGASYGGFAGATLDNGSSHESACVFSALPLSTVNVFESDDSINSLSINSSGVLSITGSLTATLNGNAIISGVTAISMGGRLDFEVLPTTLMTVSRTPSITLLPTCSVYYLELTGVTNTVNYPSGTATWLMDTYAPNDNYIFSEGDNAFPDIGDVYANWMPSRGLSTITPYLDGATSTADISTTFGGSYELTGLIIGAQYRLRFDCRPVSSTSTRVIARVSELQTLSDGNIRDGGVSEFSIDTIFEATATTMYFGSLMVSGASGDTQNYSNVSVKQTTDMQLYNALPEDFTEEST